MSRSGYTDDIDSQEAQWAAICWRGAVKSAIRGKRGQQTLRELRDALDAMPVKELAADSLVTADGAYCTLGVLGAKRGLALEALDPEDSESVAEAFGIAEALAKEIVFENDEATVYVETPEARWKRMRSWVESNITAHNVWVNRRRH